MELTLEKHKYKAEVISPTHIGSGEILSPVDYVFHNGKLYVMDVEKLIKFLSLEKQELFSKNLIQKRDLLSVLQLLNVSQTEYERYAKYTFTVTSKPSQLHCFIKNAFNNPYIPGSSIKGALRTALCYNLFSFAENKRWLFKEVYKKIQWRNAAKALQNFVESIFGSINNNKYSPHHDSLKFLKISDSETAHPSAMEIDEVVVITAKAETRGDSKIKTFVEALKAGTVLYGDLTIEKTLNLEAYFPYKRNFKNYDLLVNLENVISYAKNFASAVIDHETKFAEAHGINNLKDFYQNFKENVFQKLGEKEFILRLGWGSGYISTTIGMLLMEDARLFEQLRRKFPKLGRPYERIFPASKRVIHQQNKMTPLGWVKFTID